MGRALGDHRAAVDDRDAVGERVGLLQVVRDEHDRGPVRAQGSHLVPEIRAVLRVQTAGRLVEEEHLGPVDDAECDVQAAALAARVGAGDAVDELAERQQFDQLVGAAGGLLGAHPVQLRLQVQVLTTGGGQVGAAELADVADPATHLVRAASDVDPGDLGAAPVDRQQRRQHPHRGRLPRPVGTEQTEDLAGADGEVDAAHRLHRAAPACEGLAQPARDNCRRGCIGAAPTDDDSVTIHVDDCII